MRPAREGGAGGAARAGHPRRHQRRPARAAAAAALHAGRARSRPAARGPGGHVKRFLDLADLSRDEVLDLLALARRLEAHPEPRALAGKILGLVFFNPSLRTLASFQVGMQRLGGSSFVITPGQGTWQLETRTGAVMDGACAEHIREGLPVLASYADALGIRAFAEGKDLAHDVAETSFKAMAGVVHKPLINLESAVNHPCQSLADWKTLDEVGVPQRAKFVLSWANHPRVTPIAVPAATVHMAAHRGMEVVVLRPEGYALPPAIMDKARAAAAASGGSVRETDDRADALAGAHVVYAKEWGSTTHYGDAAGDAALRAGLKDWCVREDWFATAAAGCKFMHCLPVRRNVAVADEVLDGPRSIVLREAHNRLTAQMAVLYRLLA
ncbi:MAG: N-acetylornithine carbamoyltransferase [Gammaproteobacteria bacterium]|nr:N-acetylornithine carbamoyltransferase [Gammaproteobacteria bacterium]